MDTSETYIKMSDCPEIQDYRREEKHHDTGKWKRGDFYTTVFRDGIFTVDSKNDAWADEPQYLHHPTECIWLPRQDQLQEMMFGANYNIEHKLLFSFMVELCVQGYLELGMNTYYKQFNSMEQLWLAFVAKEKYKVWNGSEWTSA